jgi:hypothetical protein
MPYAVIFGRVKFHASEAETWLEQTGQLERRGGDGTLSADIERPGDAANAPGPDTRRTP